MGDKTGKLNDTVTVSLSVPIEVRGQMVSELLLRKPTGKDIRVAGLPFYCEDGKTEPREASVARLISMLANIPPIAVDKLAAEDWVKAMAAVLSFF